MTLLQWSWTFRFATYAQARLVSQPVLLVPAVLGGAVVGFIERGYGTVAVVALVVLTLALATVGTLYVLRREVRRQVAAAGSDVQEYALSAVSLDVGLGRDRQSLPLSELYVVRVGSDWLTLRRRGMGRRPAILFFDDAALVPQARDIIEQHGARTRT